MALAIDTKELLEQLPYLAKKFSELVGSGERFQLNRVCVYANVVHKDPALVRSVKSQFSEDPIREQAAVDWQADQDDDLDEMKVFNHLTQIGRRISGATTSSFPGNVSQKDCVEASTTPLYTSIQFPTFTAHEQRRRSPSSFHRYSVKMIIDQERFYLAPDGQYTLICGGYNLGSLYMTDLQKVVNPSFPKVMRGLGRSILFHSILPNLVDWDSDRVMGIVGKVVWHMQFDIVDLFSRITHPTSSLGKRRCGALNAFQQVSPRCVEEVARVHHPPEAKRFKGVRYRPDRNRWVAEMKPPKNNNKVSFGEFQSQTEAARVVDVAFHHYGKLLNFADTPQILSKQQTSAGLNAECKLKLVKEQAKWLKSIVSTLPSTSTSSAFARGTSGAISSIPFEIAVPLGFRSFSEITSSLSCGGSDEADDGVSQPQPWVYPDPMAGIAANGKETMEPNFGAADHAGVVNEFGEGQQWSVENAIADQMDIAITQRSDRPVDMTPSSCGYLAHSSPPRRPSSSVHITEHSSGTLTNFVSSPEAEQPSETQSMWKNFLLMSPPAPTFQVHSTCDFQDDLADGLWEQQIVGCE